MGPPFGSSHLRTSSSQAFHRLWRGKRLTLALGGLLLVLPLALALRGAWAAAAGGSAPQLVEHLDLGSIRGGGGSSSSTLPPLPRAPAVVRLEAKVDADSMVGICYKQQPLLQHVPAYVCQRLRCLWSERVHQNIDLEENALAPLAGSAGSKIGACPLPRGGQAPLAAGAQPHVSFILTIHNHAQVAAQALMELFRTAHEVPSAEFVVIDDGSTEDISPILQAVLQLRRAFGVPVKLRRNKQALGFGPANELGIKLATGKYIAVINSDMYVVKGWLAAIMQTFESSPSVGMVGPMFVGDNDLITEAGGLIFGDASAANFMRGKVPHHAFYHRRRADYISAACVVLSRAVYDKIGGFDPRYEMGYYEDTDLAMAIRGGGFEVVLQPLAVAFHQEGTTFGNDANSELKRRLMAENKQRFLAKWGTVLLEKHCPPDTDHFLASNRQAHLRLLWLDEKVLQLGSESGGSITLLQALLGAGYHVTLLPTAAEGQAPQHAAALRHAGVDVVPPLPPAQWLLSHAGRCLFDVVWVASSSAYEAVRQQLELHCPGIALARGTDGAAGLEAEEGGAGRNGSSGGSSEAKAQALPSTPQQALLQALRGVGKGPFPELLRGTCRALLPGPLSWPATGPPQVLNSGRAAGADAGQE